MRELHMNSMPPGEAVQPGTPGAPVIGKSVAPCARVLSTQFSAKSGAQVRVGLRPCHPSAPRLTRSLPARHVQLFDGVFLGRELGAGVQVRLPPILCVLATQGAATLPSAALSASCLQPAALPAPRTRPDPLPTSPHLQAKVFELVRADGSSVNKVLKVGHSDLGHTLFLNAMASSMMDLQREWELGMRLKAALEEPDGSLPGFTRTCDCTVIVRDTYRNKATFQGMIMEKINGACSKQHM